MEVRMKHTHAWVARGLFLLLFVIATALTKSEIFLGCSITLAVVWITTDITEEK